MGLARAETALLFFNDEYWIITWFKICWIFTKVCVVVSASGVQFRYLVKNPKKNFPKYHWMRTRYINKIFDHEEKAKVGDFPSCPCWALFNPYLTLVLTNSGGKENKNWINSCIDGQNGPQNQANKTGTS